MSTIEDAKKKAAATYNAAADFYDHPTNTFWERYGRRTVERLRLKPEPRVLDVVAVVVHRHFTLLMLLDHGAQLRAWISLKIFSNSRARKQNNRASQTWNSNQVSWVLGSGYRGTLEQLTEVERERVRAENLDFIKRNDVRSIEANVLYAQASA